MSWLTAAAFAALGLLPFGGLLLAAIVWGGARPRRRRLWLPALLSLVAWAAWMAVAHAAPRPWLGAAALWVAVASCALLALSRALSLPYDE